MSQTKRTEPSRLRLSVLGIVAVALFASLFARLYDLQIVGSPEFQLQAEANRVRTVHIEAPRGRILDRNGTVLVDNRVAVVVAINRSEFEDLSRGERGQLLERLAVELTRAGRPMSATEIRERLQDERYSRYAPVPIAQDVPESLKIYLDEHAEEFPSVTAERTAVREYPYGQLAAHILGYVGQINEEELTYVQAVHGDDAPKPYTRNDHIGKAGVERTYEQYLRGTPGERRIEVDAEGNPVRVIDERLPQPGDDLVLSIDIDIQAEAELRLRQGMEEARRRGAASDGTPFDPNAGAVVVEDPRNGQVLALASYPTYDPRQFVDGIDQQEWAYLNDPANHYPLNAIAIQGQYAPGSTFKLFTGYAGAMAGVRGIDDIYNDGGSYTIPGCTGLKCTRFNAGGNAYGPVDLRRAITVSSDAYFYSLGAEFWIQRQRFGGDEAMQRWLTPWGLGSETGIALTGEASGRVPTPQWRRDYCEAVQCGDPLWRAGDNVNMAIGQGDVLVTPLQLANGYATFANGGTRYVPQIALRVQDHDTGETVVSIEPEVAGRVEIPGELRQALLDGLAGVPRPGGTAAGAFAGFPLDQFPIAGKTGTAQVDGKADTAVFSAFGPIDDPRFQISVVIEEAGFGGTSSAPVARSLFDALAGFRPLPEAPLGGDLVLPSEPLSTAGAYD
ncbi:MAG TPA: penicillin-binding protein 2 [Acidimicrobiales bacterium]